MKVYERVTAEKLTQIDLVRYEFAKRFVSTKKVLDIACGTGYGTLLLYESDAQSVTGVDNNSIVIDKLIKMHTGKNNLFFVNSSAYTLPFEDNLFDIIISVETFEHLETPEQFIKEAHRVVSKINGVVIISTPLNEQEDRYKPVNPFHVREYNQFELNEILSKYFSNIEYVYQNTSLKQNWITRTINFIESFNIKVRKIKKYINPNIIKKLRLMFNSEKNIIDKTVIDKKNDSAHVIIAICKNYFL